jgi:hypothetical protein
MKLTKSEWDQLLKFQGYGNLKGPVWFLGIEEKLPDKRNRNRELRDRLQFDASMDLAHAQRLLRSDIRKAETQTWNWMSKFTLALLHPAYNWKDRETTRFYKNEYLGRSNGETFLTELFPLPAKNGKGKPYPEKYYTRRDYERQVRPARIRWLTDAIKRNKPQYVIIYGAQKTYNPLITELGAQPLRKTRWAELCLYKNHKTTTQILLFSFFRRGTSHKRVTRVLRLFTDHRSPLDGLRDHASKKDLISDGLIDQIRAGVDIAKIIKRYVRLTRRGKNLTGVCPFCETEPPSLMVSPSDQSFICFRCFVGGNVFAFLSQITSAPFSKIVRFLGHAIGIDVPVWRARARKDRLNLKRAPKRLCLPLRK